MQHKRGASGPFLSQLWFDDEEFETTARDALRGAGLLPAAPGPVDIELFVDKHFGFSYEFADLGTDCLGFISFDARGPRRMVIHRDLDAPDDVVRNRRCRSTIAHECGHGLLHTVLYVELWQEKDRLKELASDRLVHHRDRAETIDGSPRPTEWWEYQANQVMACLLLPKRLVRLCVEAAAPLDPESLARHVSDTFDVSRQMARIRLQKLELV